MLSAIALYSSGPVTPSMRKPPPTSWWPSERHSRAVATSRSSPVVARELLVLGRRLVAHHRVGDVGVDVERGCARGPVARALAVRRSSATGTRRPRGRADARARRRGRACRGASAARRGPRRAPCRSAPGGRRTPCPRTRGRRSPRRSGPSPRSRGARPAPGLEHVEQAEAHGLLQLRVALDLHVGARPEPSSTSRWDAHSPSKPVCRASASCRGPGRGRTPPTGARPAVGEELEDPQRLPGRDVGGDRHAAPTSVVASTSSSCPPGRPRRGPSRPPSAARCCGCGARACASVVRRSAPRRRAASPARPRPAGRRPGAGSGLVGDELGLDDEARAGRRPARPRSGSPRSRAG